MLADSAYGGGKTRDEIERAGHTATIKPKPLRPAVPGGFDRDDFTVDHANRTVTCPNAETVTISAKGSATFGRRCDGCPLRARCTTSRSGRSVHVSEHDRHLVAARQQAKTPEFAATYPRRSLVERSISWMATATDGAATGAYAVTSSAGVCGSRRSTSPAWSTSGCATRTAG